MKVTFISNFLNHHQLPIAEEFYAILGAEFVFVATEELPQERVNLGYHNMNGKYPFCINAYQDEKTWNLCEKIVFESDVVIFAYSSAPISLLKRRIKFNKLTFFYMERICKKETFGNLSLRRKLALIWNHRKYSRKKVYVLCASAYTSLDFSYLHMYDKKMYKWGYFPSTEQALMRETIDKTIRLIWVGRFIDWKHPELAILAVRKLLDLGYEDFHLQMIGVGPLLEKMKELAIKERVSEYITFENSKSPEEVREHMKNSDILLMTSDRNEGWGAVLNEGMNSGCVPVVNSLIGAAPYLIQHGINGMCYKNGTADEVVKAVKCLIDNKKQRTQMSREAIATICGCWNSKIAVQRFLATVCKEYDRLQFLYEDGPMSEAIVVNEAD